MLVNTTHEPRSRGNCMASVTALQHSFDFASSASGLSRGAARGNGGVAAGRTQLQLHVRNKTSVHR